MELPTPQRIDSDVLIIGSGAAGLRAAIAAREHGVAVMLLSESPAGFRSNTAISRAVFATAGVLSEAGDSPEAHLQDIISGGRLVSDRRLAATMTRGIRQQVDDLERFGVKFERREGEMRVGRAPGHSFPRHLSVAENRGINITRPMREYAASIGIRFLEGVLVTSLLRAGDRIAGVLGLDSRGQAFTVGAGSTVLATGGAGRAYRRTNNAAGSTGDGYALAYDVGAVLRDMEFVQFYPTAWGKDGGKMCFYEGLLPIGATIRNSLGEDILAKHGLSDFKLVTRDRLARTIMKEIAEGRGVDGCAVFDLTTVPEDRAQALRGVRRMSHSVTLDRVPVAPTVHFFMGGIVTDENAETGIGGLYAAGEVCGGIHGANRLGGNAISETLVFGAIAGNRGAAAAAGMRPVPVPETEVNAAMERLRELASGSRGDNPEQMWQSLRQTMWERVGVIRDGQNLQKALGEIGALREQLRAAALADHRALYQAAKLSAALTAAEMVCRAALMRTESRGAHYRSDCPDEDDGHWLKNIEIRHQNDEMALEAVPVALGS